ncbi:MAG: GNAT family N-acetyltransferase [Gemmatimonadota bacterium]
MDIQIVYPAEITATIREEVQALCRVAYDEDLDAYYASLTPTVQLLGRGDGQLVSHLMLVRRTLQPDGQAPLRTAYVELVATHPSAQRRGYASRLLRASVAEMRDFDIGALSPSDAEFYARLGWERWTGPLAVRTARGLEETPDEELMVLRLPHSPPTLDVSRRVSIEWRPGEVW